MRKYQDSKGRNITLSIDVLAVRRVKAAVAIDLTAIEAVGPDGQPLLVRLAGLDIELLVSVLYAVAEPNLQQQGIDELEFAAGLSGKALAAAQAVLFEELLDFFRDLHRTDAVRQIQAVMKLVKQGVAKSTALTEAMEIQVGKEIDAIDLPSHFFPAATPSPASSTLTPTTEPTPS